MSVATGAGPVDSPCIGTCTLDPGGHCIGCLRSLDEIARWTIMGDAERRAIIARARPPAPAPSPPG